MQFISKPNNRRPTFLPPDYSEERAGRHLLVWKDLPYWTVVDGELHRFLTELDGSRTLHDIIKSNPEWMKARKDILFALKEFEKAGVARDLDEPSREAPVQDSVFPIESISLNLTRRCNLRCRFCYNLEWLTPDKASELSADEITGFLESVRPLLGKKPSLVILGGEPLLRADELLEVASYALKHKFQALVSTNGTLVDDDFARRARNIGLQVQVSLDGHNPELNDAVRGNGSFGKAIKGIETLVKNGVYTIISLVCHKGNQPHLERFYDLALSLGVDEARFIPLKRIGGGKGGEYEPVDYRKLVLFAFDMFKRRPELVKLAGRDAFTIMGTMCRYSVPRRSCGTGLQTFLLDADGSIYPCLNTNLPEFRIGSIREPGFDFKKTWYESDALGNFRRCTAVNQADGACFDCPVRHWCAGGCRGETFVTTGKLDGRPVNCDDLRSAVIEMFWILSERPDLVKNSTATC